MKLENGKYVCDDRGCPITLRGVDELAENAMFRLKCKRGTFPLAPNLGSRLYTIPGHREKDRESAALAYINEALSGMNDISVSGISAKQDLDDYVITVYMAVKGENIEAELKI